MPAGTITVARAVLRRRVMPAMLISLAAGLVLLVPAPQAALAASQRAASISAGFGNSCAIESSNAYCWGYNANGQLLDGSTTSSSVPVAVDTSGVLAGKTLTQITGSAEATCALDSAGAAYCWGANIHGDLGDGSMTDSSVPVAVDTSGVLAGKTLTQITAGAFQTCALDSAGAAYCWGGNGSGQLGDGSTTDSSVPVAVDTSGVLAGKTLTQITTGVGATCALDSAGAVYCWGDDSNGQLGDGSTASSSVPVAVDTSGALAGKKIAAGWGATCALDSAGAAYCWGDNANGQLGDGSTASSSVPVAVDTSGVLAGKTLTQIAAGQAATCAVDSAGAVYCWGWNGDGGLGDGSTAAQSTVPVLVGPQAPTSVTATPGDTTATVSWSVPASPDGGTLTGYTATASPGGADCTTTAATTCTITGLTDGTTYSVTVVAYTTAGDSGASAPASVTPVGAPAFTSSSAYTAAFGTAFSFTVTATGSPLPNITKAGSLPPGVRFGHHRGGTATISGTPSHRAEGVYPLRLTAEDSAGTATQAFTLTITSAPAITKIPVTTARAGVPLHLTIKAAGYPVPAFTESGLLPGGLTFTGNGNGTATIAGTAATGSSGRYPIAITATNTSGTATRHFTILVLQHRRR
jgi:Fibronectin type III domain/Regulator of chromosome condensation (RCC1) repeat/Putative Ig domain